MADLNEKINQINNTPDTTAEFDPTDVQSNKAMGVLAYLSWLVLIPLFAAKGSKFARFHTNQGIVLAIAWSAWWIVEVILGIVIRAIFRTTRYVWGVPYTAVSPVGSILLTVLGLLNIAFAVLAILGIINAAQGKAKELPVIGKFRILK